jgi:hypothetical protein
VPPAATPPHLAEIVALCRTLLAAVFLVAVSSKVREWSALKAVLQFLAPSLRSTVYAVVAVVLLAAEGALVGLLIVGLSAEIVLVGVTGFLAVATLGLDALRRRGYEGGCACFGEHSARGMVGWRDILRNGVLTAVTLAALLLVVVGGAETPPLWTFPFTRVAACIAVTAGVVLSYAMLDGMLAVHGARRSGVSRNAVGAAKR